MLIFLSPDKAQATELPKFREQILSAHNIKRQIHKVPLLTEDNKLDLEAQSFAMKLANQGNIIHSSLQDRLGQGENIAMRCALQGMIYSSHLSMFTYSNMNILLPLTQLIRLIIMKVLPDKKNVICVPWKH